MTLVTQADAITLRKHCQFRVPNLEREENLLSEYTLSGKIHGKGITM